MDSKQCNGYHGAWVNDFGWSLEGIQKGEKGPILGAEIDCILHDGQAEGEAAATPLFEVRLRR